MRQYKFSVKARDDALQDMREKILEASKDLDHALDIVYNIGDHIDTLGMRESYEDVVMSYILENMQEASRDTLDNWKALDVYVAGDVGDIDNKIKRELTDRVEKAGE